ncbi:hypothetical protein [Neobacillus niacini]|uniref:hypothetical protein n=1 Tax=Neobacillus niacini TaxID=86668 RepID=UPI002856F04C|nr:hypothetical protein [Neobacillus niacini]MDR7002933.1 hypothetical protein [Neobacillus niacini]
MSEKPTMSINNDWEKLNEVVKRLEWQTDLAYDCSIQILDEQLGEKERHRLHSLSVERFNTLKGC